MSDPIQKAVERLAAQLPLQERQRALPSALAKVHRLILRTLVGSGRAPRNEQLAEILSGATVQDALQRLAKDDLIVLDAAQGEVLGAYPVTIEDTPHHLTIDGVGINAMCALDAMAVAPMFEVAVEVESRCHVTGTPIRLAVTAERVSAASPSSAVRVGVAWQQPCGHAAHSMCREMVFLADDKIAVEWQDGDLEAKSVFDLDEALEFGARFFRPLLSE